MNIAEIMTRQPAVVYTHDSLYTALQTMARAACHHLPVLSKQDHLVGVLTTQDCRRVLLAAHGIPAGPQPSTPDGDGHAALLQADPEIVRAIPVYTAMTAAPIIVEPDAPVIEATRLMLDHHVHCLPVMRGETLVGIVTTSDLLIALMRLLGD
jgi:CBS domain-containing protein